VTSPGMLERVTAYWTALHGMPVTVGEAIAG
jgi:hypothetical protein